MRVVLDPVWPWSHLWEFLTQAALSVQMLVGLCCLLLVLLPFLHWRRARHRLFLQLMGVVLGLLLLQSLRQAWGSSTLSDLLRGLGLCFLVLFPAAMVSLTISTYLGVKEATPRRLTAILALRLAAFALALIALFRPSLAFTGEEKTRSTLLIAIDDSESMTTRDTFGEARWEYLVRTLKDAEPLLKSLESGERVEPILYRFGADLRPFQMDEPGEAVGARTDFGSMLHSLFDLRDPSRPPLALLILSDGADNGAIHPALTEAVRWRNAPCPIHTFALGKETTSDSRNDIVVVGLTAEPLPVPVKGKLTLKVTIDAPGFKNRKVRLRLFLEEEEVKAQDDILTEATGNVLRITTTAPSRPGDVMVKVRVEDPRRPGEPLPGEVSDKNNEKITFVPVSREGFSVLLVDKQRAWEPQLICDALRQDSRLNLHTVWLRGNQPVSPDVGDLFQLAQKAYDVIILGDVTPEQIGAINPQALGEIARRVEQGAGLLMLGGYASFGPAWRSTPLTPLLPVETGDSQQIEKPVKMVPTEEGLRKFSYVMGMGTSAEESRAQWSMLHDLDGINRLRVLPDRTLISILATSADRDPILVARVTSKGRVLAFAGDTTHRWIRSPETQQLHRRFWLQLVRWLGRQDEQEGSVWVRPDTRNLPLRSDLGFTVGLRTKTGLDLKGGTFTAKVTGPDGAVVPVQIDSRPDGERGTFLARYGSGEYRKPGVYRIEATGEGKSPEGEAIQGTGTARFVIEDDEVEKSRRAADHAFLKKLASAGGGQFHQAGDLGRFLRKLEGRAEPQRQLDARTWPTWRTSAPSPFFVLFYLLFVALLASEWLLRRRWGLV